MGQALLQPPSFAAIADDSESNVRGQPTRLERTIKVGKHANAFFRRQTADITKVHLKLIPCPPRGREHVDVHSPAHDRRRSSGTRLEPALPLAVRCQYHVGYPIEQHA